MEAVEITKRRRMNAPLMFGIVDTVFMIMAVLFYMNSGNHIPPPPLIPFFISIIIGLTLSFFLTKSYVVAGVMVFFCIVRHFVLLNLFPVDASKVLPPPYFLLMAALLGIVTHHLHSTVQSPFSKKAHDHQRQVLSFICITGFYLSLLLSLVTYLCRGNFLFRPLSGIETLFGGIPRFASNLMTMLSKNVLEFFDHIFDYDRVLFWSFSLIPTYFIYLGAYHPFWKKKNKLLCVLGVCLSLLASIYMSSKILSGAMQSEKEPWISVFMLWLSLLAIYIGYFFLCQRRSPWFLVVIGSAFFLYAPLLLFIVILSIGLGLPLAGGGGGGNGQSKSTRKWEVHDGGVTYIIEETNNGTYFDDCNREWKTDNDGITFYRKD